MSNVPEPEEPLDTPVPQVTDRLPAFVEQLEQQISLEKLLADRYRRPLETARPLAVDAVRTKDGPHKAAEQLDSEIEQAVVAILGGNAAAGAAAAISGAAGGAIGGGVTGGISAAAGAAGAIGTIGELQVVALQGDYANTRRRAQVLRHAAFNRRLIHSSTRRESHAADGGLLKRRVDSWLVNRLVGSIS